MRKLYVIDGYSLIYRSYFAFISRPFKDRENRNVSAVYGFFSTLMMLFDNNEIDYLVVAFDSKGPTFRHEIYPEYKANRNPTPEDLHPQIPIIMDILEKAGIKYYEKQEMEADDIIASFNKSAEEQGIETVIITSDKDLMQLVNKNTSVLRPSKKGVKEYQLCNEEQVVESYGVKPEQILEYLIMLGDAADNIPGIKGVGAKTASKLLHEFGSLEEIYKNLEKLSPGLRKKFIEGKEGIKLSRKLITLKNDIFKPSDIDYKDYEIKKINWAEAASSFKAIDSKNLVSRANKLSIKQGNGAITYQEIESEQIKQKSKSPQMGLFDDDEFVEEEAPTIKSSVLNNNYEAITNIEDLVKVLSRVENGTIMAFDLETTSLDVMNCKIVGFSFCFDLDKAWYVALQAGGTAYMDWEEVKPILTDKLEKAKIVGQNFKYDYKVLKRWGITIDKIYFDTMIAAWMLNSSSGVYNMDALANRELGYKTVEFHEVVEKGKTFDSVPLEKAVRYGAEDSQVTFALYEKFKVELEKKKLDNLFYSLEMPLVKVLGNMELEGIILDKNKIDEFDSQIEKEIEEVENKIFSECGQTFNVSSPKQLQEILFVKRNLAPGRKTKSGFSTDTKVLTELARNNEDVVPKLVLEYRSLVKLRGYSKGLPLLINKRTKRIHPQFLQTGTATGRLSCKSPNLQNIPIRTAEGRKIRGCFIPKPGYTFLSADYAQIELMVLSHFSKDENLVSSFKNKEDVHKMTAVLIFDESPENVTPQQRRIAKTINFGVMYGMSAFRLSNELEISRKEAKTFIDSYFERYKGVNNFINETKIEAQKKGFVSTLLGHIRKVDEIRSANKVEQAAGERIAVNTIIQGTAAEIMKKAMLGICDRFSKDNLQSKMLLQVHDELIFEVLEEEKEKVVKIVQEEMENAMKLNVPLRCSIEFGKDWGDMH